MVTDHSKAYDQLKPIASKDNITLPDRMNVKDQALYDRLSKLSSTQFDREYMRAMVKDHQSDVAEFQRESGRAKDPDVRTYASNTLPTLQEHLRLAEDANTKVGASSSK
jgi:putative membrane protein